jgi:hypothetical protein
LVIYHTGGVLGISTGPILSPDVKCSAWLLKHARAVFVEVAKSGIIILQIIKPARIPDVEVAKSGIIILQIIKPARIADVEVAKSGIIRSFRF